MKSKKDMVKEALDAGQKLTPGEALERFGTMRLSGIIHKLKREGFPVVTIPFHTTDRFGNQVTVAQYEKGEREQGQPQDQDQVTVPAQVPVESYAERADREWKEHLKKEGRLL